MADDFEEAGFVKKCASLLAAGKYYDAESLCDGRLNESPDSAAPWRMKGMALQAQGKRKDSERCLKTAIEKEKSNPENYRALGTLMLDRGLFDDALMLFELASMFKPSPENLFMTAIADLMLGKEEDAELLMKRAVATNKDKTVEVAKGFFESNYAKDTSIPEEEKKKLKAQIERLTRSL